MPGWTEGQHGEARWPRARVRGGALDEAVGTGGNPGMISHLGAGPRREPQLLAGRAGWLGERRRSSLSGQRPQQPLRLPPAPGPRARPGCTPHRPAVLAGA